MANNRLLTSFLVSDDEAAESPFAFHAILRPSKELFQKCIQSHGAVKSLVQLADLAVNYPDWDHATVPGPLFRALVVDVEGLACKGIIFNGGLQPDLSYVY